MSRILPFKGLRPLTELASQVASLPYDVCSVEEARLYQNNPHHFYHVTRSEIDLPKGIDVHGAEVYQKAVENLERMIAEGTMVQDKTSNYYIYQLIMNGREQTGLLCASSLEDYKNGTIKKHEFTRPEKELDRINHIKSTQAQTGIVFLAYRNVADIDNLIDQWKNQYEPTYNFVAEDEITHTIWVVDDAVIVNTITQLFEEKVPATYIADGHHRAASAAKVAESFNSTLSQYFLTCIFPESQLKILDYNRVVKDLNQLSPEAFLKALENDFDVELIGVEAYRPTKTHEFGLYLSGSWYKLQAKIDSYIANDPIQVLDVSILQNNILSKILNINDPRTDTRVEFVGGIRGLQALENIVNSGKMAAAFSCYPVQLSELFEVADSGLVMPPKSTWFEPKTRDGLVVYLLKE